MSVVSPSGAEPAGAGSAGSPSPDRSGGHTPIPVGGSDPVVHRPTPELPAGTSDAQASSSGPASPTPADRDTDHRDRQSRRPRRTLLATIAVLALAGAAFLAVDRLGGDDPTADDAIEAEPLRAFAAEQRDLVDHEELDGTLTYADRPTVTARTTGTITAVADDGDLLTRGSVGYEVDARPVTVFLGTTPLYRPLAEGDEGGDVLLIEENLAALGFHATYVDEDGDPAAMADDGADEVDTGFTVDGVYDAATAEAVVRWQDDLGLDETGSIDPTDVIVLAGPALVSAVEVEPGSLVQEASPVFALSVTATERTVHTSTGGEIELVITSGPVTNGAVIHAVDELPVTALVVDPTGPIGDELGGTVGLAAGLDRTLSEGVTDGADVEALETMLVALGYDADGDLDVDEEFDEDTATAVTDWQEDLQDTWDDVVVDGVVDPADVLLVPTGTTVDRVTERDGDLSAGGALLFATTGTETTRIVETAIPAAEQDALVEGQEIEVRFPDGSMTTGIVAEVASASVRSQNDPEAEAEIPVEITMAEIPDSAAGFSELDVEVLIVDRIATGVTVVPVSALVVTGTGYAVEVSDGSGTTFVAVEPGMFADGFVEVDGIEPGTVVVTP